MQFEKKIGNYAFQMNAIIGQGSYGTVYLGRNIHTNIPVAVKTIESRRINQTNRQQLISEIESMRYLDNPNVVKLLDVQQTHNNMYIISEYCQGGDLRELIGKLTTQRAISLVLQIINGYQELMKNKIIHRDLKPANILLHNNIVKIADFGFAKQLKDNEEVMNSVAGTPLYMAPQVIMRQPYTAKCDIWSLGMILYELLFNRPPFQSQSIVDLIEEMRNNKINFECQKIDSRIKQFLESCLKLDENDRISWDEVYDHEIFQQVKQPQLNKVQVSSYQEMMVKDYYEKEFKRNQLKLQTQLNFMKFLYNLNVYSPNSEILMYSMRRLRAIEQCLNEECWNWLDIVELKNWIVSSSGMNSRNQLNKVKQLYQDKFGYEDIQVFSIQLEREIQKYSIALLQWFKDTEQSSDLSFQYMILQIASILQKELTQGAEALLHVCVEDIQFLQGVPQEEIRRRMYEIQQQM